MNKILTGFETLSGLQKYFSAPFRLTKFEYYSLSSRRIEPFSILNEQKNNPT